MSDDNAPPRPRTPTIDDPFTTSRTRAEHDKEGTKPHRHGLPDAWYGAQRKYNRNRRTARGTARDDISRMTTLAQLRAKAAAEGVDIPRSGTIGVRKRGLRRAIARKKAGSKGRKLEGEEQQRPQERSAEDAANERESRTRTLKLARLAAERGLYRDPQSGEDLPFLTLRPSEQDIDRTFHQTNVVGDGTCFWRAFSKAYHGDQKYWYFVRDNARFLWKRVYSNPPNHESGQRRSLYNNMKDMNGDAVDREVNINGIYASVEAAQVVSDFYGVRIVMFQPSFADRAGASTSLDDELTWQIVQQPSWGTMFRGPPDGTKVFLTNYMNIPHWTALEQVEGLDYQEPNLNNGDRELCEHPLPFTQTAYPQRFQWSSQLIPEIERRKDVRNRILRDEDTRS